MKTKKRRSGVFIKAALAVLAVYMVYNLIALRMDISEKESEIAALDAEIQSLTLENMQLSALAGKELTDEEIAEIARERLGYSLPGERIFVDITGK